MPQPDDAPLFTPYALGGLQLRNRVVMASMTPGRARNAELAPTELHVEYYRQRAAVGLILTEGTWISPRAVGFLLAQSEMTCRQMIFVASFRNSTGRTFRRIWKRFRCSAHGAREKLYYGTVGNSMGAIRGEDVVPLVGMSRRASLVENLKALDVTLTKVDLDDLDGSFALGAITGDRYPARMKHLTAK